MSPSVMNASEFRSPTEILPPISYASQRPKKNTLVPTSVWLLIVGIRLLSILVLVQQASLCYRYGFLATATTLSLNLNPRSKPKLPRWQVILGLPGIPPTPEK